MTFRVLPGLPGHGAPAEQFSFGDKRTHSEGVVVEFTAATERWVGNFQPAIGPCSAALPHPDRRQVVVLAGGQGYIVDPATRRLLETFGGGINGVWSAQEGDLLLFDDAGIRFSALGSTGWRWNSARISWDGFKGLALENRVLTGQAWNAVDQSWQPFSLALGDGRVTGGAYVELGDMNSRVDG